MKKYFLPLILSASLLLNLTFSIHLLKENIVDYVVDGDTFQLNSGRRVKLLGVNAHEYNECFGQEATEKLTQLIAHKPVFLLENRPDFYHRTLALVYSDFKLINLEMLKQGFAKPDYSQSTKEKEFLEAVKEAKKEKLGLWGKCNNQ